MEAVQRLEAAGAGKELVMEARKNAWKERGFTMAELLIVVAIIAVLAAIAIPIFTSQLEKSREGTDADTIRNEYAKAALKALDKETGGDGDVTVETGTGTNEGKIYVTQSGIKFEQEDSTWSQISDFDVAGVKITKNSKSPTKDYDCAITYVFEGEDLVGIAIGQNIDGQLGSTKYGDYGNTAGAWPA